MLSFNFVFNKQSILNKIYSVSTSLSLDFFPPDTASLLHPNNLLQYLVIPFITFTLFIPGIMMK